MARDIEEFLRQAAQRRQDKLRQRQQPPAGQQPQPVPRQPVQAGPPPRRPPQQRPLAPPAPNQPRRDFHVIEAVEAGQAVPLQQRHLETRIDTRQISQKGEALGRRIEIVGGLVDDRIHSKFDHDLGQLNVGDKISDDETFVQQSGISAAALSLLRAFRNPTEIRQAIVMSELLKRPEFD